MSRDDARIGLSRGALALIAASLCLGLIGIATLAWVVITRPWEAPSGREHFAWVAVWMPDAPSEDLLGLVQDPLPSAEWDALVDAVRTVDPEATVSLTAYTRFAARDSVTHLHAIDGALPEEVLVAGRAPRQGEVVLAVDLADDLGVGVGDQLPLAAPAPLKPLAVVGLSSADESAGVVPPRGYVSTADAPALIAAYAPLRADDAAVTDGYLDWDGDVPATVEPYLFPEPPTD